MKLEIETYKALPCTTSIFKINGINANEDDFGEQISEGDGDYGCKKNEFIPYLEPPSGVLKKYKISEEEFFSIACELQDKISVFDCGWCV